MVRFVLASTLASTARNIWASIKKADEMHAASAHDASTTMRRLVSIWMKGRGGDAMSNQTFFHRKINRHRPQSFSFSNSNLGTPAHVEACSAVNTGESNSTSSPSDFNRS